VVTHSRVETLCKEALTGVQRALVVSGQQQVDPATLSSASGAREEPRPVPAAAPLGAAPTITNLTNVLESRQTVLDTCRKVYAPEVTRLEVGVTIAPTGSVTGVAWGEVDGSSRFAGCVERVVKGGQLEPFAGEPVLLRTILQFSSR
jgi:hypothetical protein